MPSLAEVEFDSQTIAPISGAARLDFMDGIRGAAAFCVLLAHCMIWGGWYGIPLPDPKFAVDVFMVMSGYLMFHLAETRKIQEPPGQLASMVKFWTRRFFRIAPVYYVVLVCVFLLSNYMKSGLEVLQHASLKRWVGTQYYPLPLDYSVKSFLMHISFLFGLDPAYASSTALPDWSIGLEMQFYAVFPFLWMMFCWLRPIVATLAIGMIWITCNTLTTFPHFPEPSFLPLKLGYFLVGMLVASANRSFDIRPLDAAFQVLLAIFIAFGHSTSVLVAALLMCLMVSATDESEWLLSGTRRILTPVLCNRVTRFMSEMSYGVYLAHGVVIAIFGGWLYSQAPVQHLRPVFKTILLTIVTMLASYAIAWLMNQAIEKPGIELGRRYVTWMGKSRDKDI